MSLGDDFRLSLAVADAVIASVPEEQAAEPVRDGGWSRKQLLGHLIDSAAHNHVRFVTAANSGPIDVKEYHQEGCVNLHGYADMSWDAIVRHWKHENELIACVVERIPESSYPVPCKLADGNVMTLEELIRDYLAHLSHHLVQMRVARD